MKRINESRIIVSNEDLFQMLGLDVSLLEHESTEISLCGGASGDGILIKFTQEEPEIKRPPFVVQGTQTFTNRAFIAQVVGEEVAPPPREQDLARAWNRGEKAAKRLQGKDNIKHNQPYFTPELKELYNSGFFTTLRNMHGVTGEECDAAYGAGYQSVYTPCKEPHNPLLKYFFDSGVFNAMRA